MREIGNFWDQGGYKVDGQRILDNIQQVDLLHKYFEERAIIGMLHTDCVSLTVICSYRQRPIMRRS